MECLNCDEQTHVLETRINRKRSDKGWVVRRRRCLSCGHIFKTVELPQAELVIEEREDAGNG